MRFLPLVLVFSLTSVTLAEDPPSKKVLIIGIDGCRPDALLAAKTPNLREPDA